MHAQPAAPPQVGAHAAFEVHRVVALSSHRGAHTTLTGTRWASAHISS